MGLLALQTNGKNWGKERRGPNFSRGDHLFQLEKGGPNVSKGGGGGADFFRKILLPPDHFFSEIFGPGGLFWGDQLLRDRSFADIVDTAMYRDMSKILRYCIAIFIELLFINMQVNQKLLEVVCTIGKKQGTMRLLHLQIQDSCTIYQTSCTVTYRILFPSFLHHQTYIPPITFSIYKFLIDLFP